MGFAIDTPNEIKWSSETQKYWGSTIIQSVFDKLLDIKIYRYIAQEFRNDVFPKYFLSN